jgi:NAD(P)H-nitrite reductase large subunit
MNDDMMLCRCEEVISSEIEAAIGEGATTLNDIKRRTRAGMGLCQGRWCSHALAALVAERTGQSPAALAPMTARPPVCPISLGVLADTES